MATGTVQTQQTSRLGTALKFRVFDMRGITDDFPRGPGGFVFQYREHRTISCRLTGNDIERSARYVIFCEHDKGWRIDLIPPLGPKEAVYGVDGESHWKTSKEAATALSGRLDEIRDNSVKGS